MMVNCKMSVFSEGHQTWERVKNGENNLANWLTEMFPPQVPFVAFPDKLPLAIYHNDYPPLYECLLIEFNQSLKQE